MKDPRTYQSRGTPDCPIALYPIKPKNESLCRMFRHPELEILILQAGQVTYRVDNADYTMNAGDVLLIAPDQLHGLICYTPDARFRALIAALDAIAMPEHHIFQKEFVLPLQNSLLQLPTHLHSEHPAHAEVSEVLKALPKCRMLEPNYKLHRYRTVVSVCVAVIPWCVPLDTHIKEALPNNKTVRKAMLYIHNNVRRSLDLQAIADHVHLHPNYLCALFKAHTGRTVMQYLIQKRIDAATFLLRDSNLSIEAIAERSGFGSRGLFFRHFREITGITPKAYQKLHSQRTQTTPVKEE